jgi:DNA-binding Lrp family transcriptional regulator
MNAILKKVPDDFPITERPFRDVAEMKGITEEELLESLKNLRREGTIRRFAAILFHRKAAYTHNAMVVWRVPEDEAQETGPVMAAFPEVSHCYERETGGYWDYTLYTMIHCVDIVRRISEKVGVKDFRMFLSKREFKKTALVADYE